MEPERVPGEFQEGQTFSQWIETADEGTRRRFTTWLRAWVDFQRGDPQGAATIVAWLEKLNQSQIQELAENLKARECPEDQRGV